MCSKKFTMNTILTAVLMCLAMQCNAKCIETSAGNGAKEYNGTYPMTPAVIEDGIKTYRIGLIADLDQNATGSKDQKMWHSYLRMGHLSYNTNDNSVQVKIDRDESLISSGYSFKERGMELSELITFDGRIFTVDDRTGIVFQLDSNKAIPWIILVDGPGNTTKGFKSEWATVKDDVLYVGSTGQEWLTAAGDVENINAMFIKTVTATGVVHHVNWIENYKAIQAAVGIKWPGYITHESAVWSPIKKKWYFLPRKCTNEAFNRIKSELMGCNKLISTDENFQDITIVKLAQYQPYLGYSSLKLLPGSDDNVFVALLSEEFHGKTATFITAFTADGETLLSPFEIDTHFKYEGIEFF